MTVRALKTYICSNMWTAALWFCFSTRPNPGCKLLVGDNDVDNDAHQAVFAPFPTFYSERLCAQIAAPLRVCHSPRCWNNLLTCAAFTRSPGRISDPPASAVVVLMATWGRREGMERRGGGLNFYITCIISSPPPSCPPLPPPPSSDRHLQSDQITHYYRILSSDYRYSVQWPWMDVHVRTHTHTLKQGCSFSRPLRPANSVPVKMLMGRPTSLISCVWEMVGLRQRLSISKDIWKHLCP